MHILASNSGRNYRATLYTCPQRFIRRHSYRGTARTLTEDLLVLDEAWSFSFGSHELQKRILKDTSLDIDGNKNPTRFSNMPTFLSMHSVELPTSSEIPAYVSEQSQSQRLRRIFTPCERCRSRVWQPLHSSRSADEEMEQG